MRNHLLFIFFLFSLTGVFAQQNLKSSQYVSLKGTAELKPDSYTAIYKVPRDSCFIVTDIFVYEPSANDVLSHYLYANDQLVLRVINGEWLNMSTGILFKSESEVNFRNTRNLKNSYSYNISGYLIKQE